MLTQCPNCETTFRVTSEILRVAQGQVRCGRCQTQFDALQRLIEERPQGAAAPMRPRAAATVDAVDAVETADIEVEEERDTVEEITMEGKRIEISGTYRVIDEADAQGGTQLRQEVVEEWMEIDDDEIGSTPEEGYIDVSEDTDEAAEPAELEDSRERLRREFSAIDDDDGASSTDDGPDTNVRAWRQSSAAAVDADDDLPLPGGRMRRQPIALAWKILFVPLLLVLAAQIVHHNRAELARDPRIGDELMKVYRALNLDLTPDWDLHAYEIRQWGVITDASVPGTLKVRASIINRAAFPQPYPLLKLVLEDRWGDQVRAREFEPADYLDPGVSAERLFAPGAQANATIVIVDPGPDAEGFRFDVCLRGEAGPVCASEVPEAAKR